jgi:hypothetical protein
MRSHLPQVDAALPHIIPQPLGPQDAQSDAHLHPSNKGQLSIICRWQSGAIA